MEHAGAWYQCGFEGHPGAHHLAEIMALEAKNWPSGASVGARMSAGIGPLGLGGYGKPAPQYESRYLRRRGG